MQYSVVELAAAINTPAETIRDWANLTDIPHTRDTREHIWIDGEAFRAWVVQLRIARRRIKLQDGEAYCCSCDKAVVPAQSEERIREIKLKASPASHTARPSLHWRKVLTGICPQCGHKVNRVLVCGR